jgi:hypothetical protein
MDRKIRSPRVWIRCASFGGIFSIAPLVVLPTPADAADVPLTCETFCSPTKLRTAVARLSWTDPNLRLAEPSEARAAPAPVTIQTTVFKDGFDDQLFATIPTAPDARAEPAFETPPEGPQSLRAFDLRLTGIVRPEIAGEFSSEATPRSSEQQQTSVTIENLEPGLTYFWRLSFTRNGEQVLSETAACPAPICVADMREGE